MPDTNSKTPVMYKGIDWSGLDPDFIDSHGRPCWSVTGYRPTDTFISATRRLEVLMGMADKLQGTQAPDDSGADPFGGDNLDLPTKPGEYLLEVVPDYTTDKKTNSGGEMLKMQCKILGPTYEGKHVFFQFIYDCPSNRDFEKQEKERVMYLWKKCGGEGVPDASDFHGRRFIARLGLEENTYKGKTEYRETLWGVKAESEGPASGPFSDDKMPDVWHKAVAHAKGEGGDDINESVDEPQGESDPFDDDEIPF